MLHSGGGWQLSDDAAVRFQQADDPTRFCLYEVYHSKDALAAHRETPHFLTWRDAVKEMMAGERTRTDYVNLYPPDEAW